MRTELMDTGPGLFKVIETDTMTGWKRYLDNMKTSPWTGTFTREEAEACVDWRKKNITGRYAYRIVPVEPHMTDNDATRERQARHHGSHRMEDCTDVDCREAAIRLLHEDLDRRFASEQASAPSVPAAAPFETGAPFRSAAEAEWDGSRDG